MTDTIIIHDECDVPNMSTEGDSIIGGEGEKGDPGLIYRGIWLDGTPIYDDPIVYDDYSWYDATYNGGVGYMKDDCVYYLGTTYICVEDGTTENPVDAPLKWNILALKGDKGDTGEAYIHTQGSASTLWTINHNLGYFPSTTVFNTGGQQVDCGIVNVTTNQVQVSFSTAIAGTARLV